MKKKSSFCVNFGFLRAGLFGAALFAASVVDGAASNSCIIDGSTNRVPTSAESRILTGTFNSRWFDCETDWLLEGFRIRFSGFTVTIR